MSTATYPAGFKRLQGGGTAVEVVTKTASFTLTREDSGRVFILGAADLVASLPPTEAGLTYTFILAAAGLSAGTGFEASPVAADAINGNGLTSTDNEDLTLTGATDREGDFVSLVADGLDGWYITGISGIWAKTT